MAGAGLETVTVACAVLLAATGSQIEVREAVFVIIVPFGTAHATRAETSTCALVATSSVEQETVPPEPTGGVVQVQPGAETASKVIGAGRTSVTTTCCDTSGPPLEAVRVKVTVPPLTAPDAVFAIEASAAGFRKKATGMSWSERRSGRVSSFRSDSGKSASLRAYWSSRTFPVSDCVTSTWSRTCALPSNTYE